MPEPPRLGYTDMGSVNLLGTFFTAPVLEQVRSVSHDRARSDVTYVFLWLFVDDFDFRRCSYVFFQSQVEAFATEFVATNPRLNILVNNAGGMPSARTLSPQGNESIMVRERKKMKADRRCGWIVELHGVDDRALTAAVFILRCRFQC